MIFHYIYRQRKYSSLYIDFSNTNVSNTARWKNKIPVGALTRLYSQRCNTSFTQGHTELTRIHPHSLKQYQNTLPYTCDVLILLQIPLIDLMCLTKTLFKPALTLYALTVYGWQNVHCHKRIFPAWETFPYMCRY